MKRLFFGLLLALLSGAMGQAKAAYCDYCHSTGYTMCANAYVSVRDLDGNWTTVVAGSLCTITYDRVEPSEFNEFWDSAYAGGGAFRFPVKYVIDHLVSNPHPATCHSSWAARLDSANFDVAKRQAANLTTGKIARAGELVRVTYDDDSWEVWQIALPYSSEPLDTTPVRGPFNCD